MHSWLLRHRWLLALGVLAAGAGAITALTLWGVVPLAAPYVGRANEIAACTMTLIRQHQRVIAVLPQGPQWLVRPASWCAPVSLRSTVAGWERIGGAAILAILLLRKRGRRLVSTVWYWVQGIGWLVPGTTHGRARWARRRELRRHWPRPWEPPFVLGTAKGCVVALRAAEQNLNVLIIGAPGVGKSTALFMANLLRAAAWRWPGKLRPSRVMTDPKGELYAVTSRAMARHHVVRRVDFYDREGARYNPLAHIHTPSDAQRFADLLLENTGGRSHDTPFWDATAVLVIVAAIEHLNALARGAGRDAATLAELAAFVGRADVGAMQQEMLRSVPTARRAAEQFLANVRKKPELEGSIQAGLPLRFQFLNDPAIAAVTGGNDIDFRALGRKAGQPWAIYVVVTRGREEVLKPLVVAFFTQMFDILVQDANARAERTGQPTLERPVICDLDEAGTIGKIADLAGWLNTLRSAGIWCRLAVQTLAQLVTIYGEVGAEAITQACQTFVFFGGPQVGKHDAAWMSEQLGRTTVVQEQRTAGRKRTALLVEHGSLARSEAGRPLMDPADFLRLTRHWMVVVPRHAWPMKLRAHPYSKSGSLRRRAGSLPRPGPGALVQGPAPTAGAPAFRQPYEWHGSGTPVGVRPRHEMDWEYDL